MQQNIRNYKLLQALQKDRQAGALPLVMACYKDLAESSRKPRCFVYEY